MPKASPAKMPPLPRFDRGLDFAQPDDRLLFRFDRRGRFDFEVLKRLFDELPRGAGEKAPRIHRHDAPQAIFRAPRRRLGTDAALPV